MWKEIFTINWHAAIDVVWFCQQQRITTSRLCINPNIFLAWLHSQNHSPHDWNYGKWASELALSPCYFACGRISLCRSTQTQCAHTFFIYIIITIIIMMAASRFTYNIIFSMLLSAVILPIATDFSVDLVWFACPCILLVLSFVPFVGSRLYFNNFLFARTHIPNWRIQQRLIFIFPS